jgi:hypothetical protein
MPIETLSSLASIDGATLISTTGELLAYGAVVPSRPSGSEGARSSAAKELSRHGLVIKISADGPMTLLEKGEQVLEM